MPGAPVQHAGCRSRPPRRGSLPEQAVQLDDTLRGPALAALPFFEPKRVIRFLESEAEHQSPEQRGEYFRTLTLINTLSILGERYGL